MKVTEYYFNAVQLQLGNSRDKTTGIFIGGKTVKLLIDEWYRY